MIEGGVKISKPAQLLLIVPRAPQRAPVEADDREGAIAHGGAYITTLNLSGLEAKPIETGAFVDKLLTPITGAMRAIEAKFEGLAIEEIKISLAVTAEGDIGVASAGVESSIEITLKWHTVGHGKTDTG